MTNIRDDISLRDDTFAEWLSIHHERANPALQTDHRVAFNAGWYSQQARIEALTKALERLEYWFDTDDEILEDMDIDKLEDHKRQHQHILAALKGSDT